MRVIGPHRLKVPRKLRAAVRRVPESHVLHQVGEDIWTCYAPVAEHVDNTTPGCLTYGFIIVNDPKVVLRYDGHDYPIPPGTLYCIDATAEHSTEGDFGLLAALIWDMPEYSFEKFEAELMADPRFK